MKPAGLPQNEMRQAFDRRDASYEGLFFVAVKTTGIFCRPTCPARRPRPENMTFYTSSREALDAGYRPCKRCRPLEVAGAMPDWLEKLMRVVDAEPLRRWSDREIRHAGVDPARVRRWFQANHAITFQAFLRSRRLSAALAQLSVGDDPLRVAYDAGYESVSGFREAFQNWFGTTPGRIHEGRLVLVNRIQSPLGPLVAAADEHHLLLLEFADRRMLPTQLRTLARHLKCRYQPGENRWLEQAQRELQQYFAGRRERFEVRFRAPGTEFQRHVWQQLLELDFGQTASYQQIAHSLRRPSASRAVGRANGDNRLAIVIPCHRVVRADGTLCGYGGGLRRKQWLLRHERTVRQASR